MLSAILTLVAFHRFEQEVIHLNAERDGSPLPRIDQSGWSAGGRLVPDVAMINTFPRMSHIVEYMELTWDPELIDGRPASRTGVRRVTCDTGGPGPRRGDRRHRGADWTEIRAGAWKQPCDVRPYCYTWGILKTDCSEVARDPHALIGGP